MENGPENDRENYDGSDEHPHRVTSCIPRLRAADGVSNGSGSVRDAIHRAINEANVYHFP
jgi:hypothetical protein